MKKQEAKELIYKFLEKQTLGDKFADTFLELIFDKNHFYTTEDLLWWLDNKRKSCKLEVNEVNVSNLCDWNVAPSGNIQHHSGDFYSIVGVSVKNADREVPSWDQPMIKQKEMGVLGIITTVYDDTRYYILHAKEEPGNIYKIQLSPTLQATYSNLNQVHKGKKTLFSDLFYDLESNKNVIYKKWLAEEGGRFYLKTNLNVLLDVSNFDLKTLPEDYKPFTLSQIKEFLRYDNLINPHIRSIIAHI